MRECDKIRRQLSDPASGWDREVLAHCRSCSDCRREMLAQLSGNNVEGFATTPALDARTLGACHEYSRRRRRTFRRALWSGAAVAAACFCIGFGAIFFRPAPPCSDTARFKADPEWTGSGLERALDEIGEELSVTQQELAKDELEDLV